MLTLTPPLVEYLPLAERTPDTQYRDLLRRILREGTEISTTHGVGALKVIGHLMRFPLANGFPVVTERDLVSPPQRSDRPSQFHQALGELCAFLNGAHTQEELERFGCYWWAHWLTPESCARFDLPPGDLGPGSYGRAFRAFPTSEGLPFDQFAHLVDQIRQYPALRYHEISPWIPQYISRANGNRQRVVVPPCHGWIHVHVHPVRRELTLTHRQRSADAPVGLAFNLIHYAALTLMLGQVTGYRPVELVYFLDDVHVYLNQVEHVETMLATEPQVLPTVTLDPTVTDLFAFRREHFSIADYHPRLPRMRIPTPL